jgi:hypothetical protein
MSHSRMPYGHGVDESFDIMVWQAPPPMSGDRVDESMHHDFRRRRRSRQIQRGGAVRWICGADRTDTRPGAADSDCAVK